RYIAAEHASEAGLRKPTERTGEIRVIDIEGLDRSACGGTHVRMTGEIGPVLITGTERVRKLARVHFVCGVRATRYGKEIHRRLSEAVQALSDERQSARKRIEELEGRLLDYEAAVLVPENGIVKGSFKGRGIESIKMLALRVCARPGIVVVFADESDQL